MVSRIGLPLLFLLVLAVFGRTLGFDFINYDDPIYVYENEVVKQGWGGEGVRWAAVSVGETNLWHPVTWLSHMLDVEVFGVGRPGGHHAVNLLWHGIGALGLSLLLRRLTGNMWLAVFLAALWAVHPQRVQSVCWVSERKDVLSGAFFFWSWWSWERWTESRAMKWYGLALGLFALAGMSKPSVVPLPAVLWVGQMLREGWSLKRGTVWGVKLLPFAAVSLVVAVLTVHFQRTGGMADVGEGLPWIRRFLLMPVSLWWYVEGFFLPGNGRLWVYPPQGAMRVWILPSLGLLALAGLIGWRWRSDRLALWGGATLLLMWLPVSGLVPVSFYFVADRYSYLIHVGLLMVVGGLLRHPGVAFQKPGSRGVALAFGVLLVAAAGTISCLRCGHWRNSDILFSHERTINPRSLLASIHLGAVREGQGREEEALALFQEALEIDGGSGLAATNAGRMLLRMGRKAEAEAMFAEAGRRKVLHEVTPFRLQAQLLAERGEAAEASRVLSGGLDRFPDSLPLMMDLGALCQAYLKDQEAALAWYGRVLAQEPEHADAMQGKGVALIKMGMVTEGRNVLRDLARKHPERKAVQEYLDGGVK